VSRETSVAVPLWMWSRRRQWANHSLWELQSGIIVNWDDQFGNTERSGGASHHL
jgi:hypothetical protein